MSWYVDGRMIAANPNVTVALLCEMDSFGNLHDAPNAVRNGPILAASENMLAVLKDVLSFLKTAPLESGYCCCGSPVASHGMGDGHSPVDDLAHYAGGLEERVATVLAQAKPTA